VYPTSKKRGDGQLEMTHSKRPVSSSDVDILKKCAKVPLTLNLGAAGRPIPQSIAVRGVDLIYFENFCTVEDMFNVWRMHADLRATVTVLDLSLYCQMMIQVKDLGGLASCLNLAIACGFSYEDVFPYETDDTPGDGSSYATIMAQAKADAASLAMSANSSISPFNALPLEGSALPDCLAWATKKEKKQFTSCPRITYVECVGEAYTIFVSQEYEDLIETREEMFAEFRVTKKLGTKLVSPGDIPAWFRYYARAFNEVSQSAKGATEGSVHRACEEESCNLRLWNRVENGYRNAVLERAEVVAVVGSGTVTQFFATSLQFLEPTKMQKPPYPLVPLAASSTTLPCLEENILEGGEFLWDESAALELLSSSS
jgi:hypothetical protein